MVERWGYMCLKEVFELVDAEVDYLFFTFFEEVLLDFGVVVEALLDIEIVWR